MIIFRPELIILKFHKPSNTTLNLVALCFQSPKLLCTYFIELVTTLDAVVKTVDNNLIMDALECCVVEFQFRQKNNTRVVYSF